MLSIQKIKYIDMKRQEIYSIIQTINTVSDLKGVKFSYAIIKNKKKIEEEIKVLEEVVKPSEKYAEFEKVRIQLCEFYSEKDANNNPVVEENKYKITDQEVFNTELLKIKDEYNTYITDRENQINEYNKMLSEDISIDFTKINFIDLPIDITPKQLEDISFMVNFD
jgi:hypothetical protein